MSLRELVRHEFPVGMSPTALRKDEPMEKAKFILGRSVATPGALAALSQANQDPLALLARHQQGDWGDLSEEDQKENEFSVLNDLRILSAYTLTTGVTVWLITEADRSVTTFLLPDEY